MAVNLEKLTIKATEALQESQRDAENRGHQEIGIEHLLLVLISQEGGVVSPIIEKVGADPDKISSLLKRELEGLPRVSGLNQAYISPSLNNLFNALQTDSSSSTTNTTGFSMIIPIHI